MQTHIAFERQRDVAVLTLACDTEGKPPTIDWTVLDELSERLQEVRSVAGEVRALLLRSSSPRYFCVGADVRALETLRAGVEVER